LKLTTIFWVILAIFGFFAALRYSAFFFGFLSTGIFLLIYELKTKPMPIVNTRPQPSTFTQTTNTCLNCGMILRLGVAFCPRCGEKVIKE
jgi:hypothetical protein